MRSGTFLFTEWFLEWQIGGLEITNKSVCAGSLQKMNSVIPAIQYCYSNCSIEMYAANW